MKRYFLLLALIPGFFAFGNEATPTNQTLSQNPNSIYSSSLDVLSEADSYEYIQRRRRKRRRGGRSRKSSSPMGFGVHLMTFNMGSFSRSFGLGGTFDYAIENRKGKQKYGFYGMLNISLPTSLKNEVQLMDQNGETVNQSTSSTWKSSSYYIGGGTKLYAIGQSGSKFNWNLKFGAGYMIVPMKHAFGSYDKSQYQAPWPSESETLSDVVIELGTGIEMDLSFARLSLSADLYLPPNEKNGQAYQSDLSGATSIKLGLKFPLGR